MTNPRLGPTVRPGDTAPRFESIAHNVVVDSTVLAVAQNADLRLVFFYLAAGTEHTLPHVNKRSRRSTPPAPAPRLGYGWWARGTDGRLAWGVTHTRLWEGEATLTEAIRDVCERHPRLDVLMLADVAALVQEELRRPVVPVPRP